MIVVGEVPRVTIDVSKNGLYLFLGEGAIGKTFLAEALSSYQEYGFYVVTYLNGKVDSFGDIDSANIIMFDRLDLYVSEGISTIIYKYSKEKVILVDLKNLEMLNTLFKGCNWGFVDIELSGDSNIFVRSM